MNKLQSWEDNYKHKSAHVEPNGGLLIFFIDQVFSTNNQLFWEVGSCSYYLAEDMTNLNSYFITYSWNNGE